VNVSGVILESSKQFLVWLHPCRGEQGRRDRRADCGTPSAPGEAGAQSEVQVLHAERASDPLRLRVMGGESRGSSL